MLKAGSLIQENGKLFHFYIYVWLAELCYMYEIELLQIWWYFLGNLIEIRRSLCKEICLLQTYLGNMYFFWYEKLWKSNML